ncbi:hypothetical protein [Staphylococcus haemolyticus]|uniref:hypothetical protein n=2 Tax=Staphylococcus haemolyticus TaxID=1283 RepID=UPI00051D2CAF|nr:hypothetical protein [Staphylococcus haemolyticus]KGJ25366.1 hypothetical protein ES24_09795 [Staphylococcus haemolyticus]KGJ29248.1 hypothetical protein ES23_05710 [Staphylococcus haemolyticus]MCH4326206.1 hypothetical protein [Staphylococcus haemolyticus]MCH4414269.1 hypothetical protein [Staphylococcus haemolyticus]MCH4456599.1 hypothetical protein [Staphylococcus haemolyticus]
MIKIKPLFKCWDKMEEKIEVVIEINWFDETVQLLNGEYRALDEVKLIQTTTLSDEKLKILKKELLKDYPLLSNRLQGYKEKWLNNSASWTLTDYYFQFGKLQQLTGILHFIDELDGTSEFQNLLSTLRGQ